MFTYICQKHLKPYIHAENTYNIQLHLTTSLSKSEPRQVQWFIT